MLIDSQHFQLGQQSTIGSRTRRFFFVMHKRHHCPTTSRVFFPRDLFHGPIISNVGAAASCSVQRSRRLQDHMLLRKLALNPITTTLGIRTQFVVICNLLWMISLSCNTILLHVASDSLNLSIPWDDRICALELLLLRSSCNLHCSPISCRVTLFVPMLH